ncbi:hypothetical protein GGX14DRAFT_560457 [Mycena pura]|uniref:Brain protein I3 n=1 Tax=Mycena pura TaxID=153505 RepID=A0AAD6YIE8_9AGAR|nr:hypothetical protein GGX14DRAFT_560457 [Mycena pura]
MPAASSTDKGPPNYQEAPQTYATQPGAQPQQGYAQPYAQPQQGYPQGQPYPPHPQFQTQPSAAQVGEEYRAQLFAQCAQGIHQPTTKYGMCGIITAILCFPIGLICLFTDTEQKCDRCGIKLS